MISKDLNKIFKLGQKLFPICRSITGPGIYNSLKILKEFNKDIIIKKERSGKKVFDWKIPPEWSIRDAFIIDNKNKKIIDFKKNNLHVVNFSKPISAFLKKKQILNKIYSLPKIKDAIPYVTSYYKRDWGFCTTYKDKIKILETYKDNDLFEVVIDSKLKKNGYLHYGECLLKGASSREILISTYLCHPSMANNELSGPMLSSLLLKYFSKKKNKYSLRFIFIPETIGSIVYLNKNLKRLKKKFLCGYNLSCVGDGRAYSVVSSKYDNTLGDKYINKSLKKLKIIYKKYSFLERGSDERQFNSPNIDLPVVTFCRSKFGSFKEYHNSLDNFKLVTKKNMKDSFKVMRSTIDLIMKSERPVATKFCEPFLQKYQLHESINLKRKGKKAEKIKNLLNFVQYADGTNDLEDISKLIKVKKSDVNKLNSLLLKNDLIKYL